MEASRGGRHVFRTVYTLYTICDQYAGKLQPL